MNWWEDPALDKALWRDEDVRWPWWKNGGPGVELVLREFTAQFPLQGVYSFKVMERAVCRENMARAKKNYRQKKRGL